MKTALVKEFHSGTKALGRNSVLPAHSWQVYIGRKPKPGLSWPPYWVCFVNKTRKLRVFRVFFVLKTKTVGGVRLNGRLRLGPGPWVSNSCSQVLRNGPWLAVEGGPEMSGCACWFAWCLCKEKLKNEIPGANDAYLIDSKNIRKHTDANQHQRHGPVYRVPQFSFEKNLRSEPRPPKREELSKSERHCLLRGLTY